LAGDRRPHRGRAGRGRARARLAVAAILEDVIDWKLAGQVARGVANLQPAGDPAPYRLLDGPAAESERLVSAYTGLQAEGMPVPEAVDRPAWIDANLTSMEAVLEPAARRLAGGL